MFNLRKSQQRDSILNFLNRKNFHPTADEVYTALRKQYRSISLATVYRNLDQLCKIGKVVKIESPARSACYDGNTEKHHHVFCVECGRVNDVWPDKILLDKISTIKAVNGFSVHSFNIIFQGICSECSAEKISPAEEEGL